MINIVDPRFVYLKEIRESLLQYVATVEKAMEDSDSLLVQERRSNAVEIERLHQEIARLKEL